MSDLLPKADLQHAFWNVRKVPATRDCKIVILIMRRAPRNVCTRAGNGWFPHQPIAGGRR